MIVIQLKLRFFKEMDQWIEKHGKKASEMDVDEMRKMQMVYMQQLHHWSQQQQKVGPRSSAIHPEACKKSIEILAIFCTHDCVGALAEPIAIITPRLTQLLEEMW